MSQHDVQVQFNLSRKLDYSQSVYNSISNKQRCKNQWKIACNAIEGNLYYHLNLYYQIPAGYKKWKKIPPARPNSILNKWWKTEIFF